MESKKFDSSSIVASPSIFSWSQAYNAGSLFAVFSLKNTLSEQKEEQLGSAGKDFINNLEAEYFTIETKNLSTIKEAIEAALSKITKFEGLKISLTVAAVVQSVLYVFTVGSGKIFLRRKGSIGIILQGQEKEEILSASGFLEEADTIVLTTEEFSSIISDLELKEALGTSDPFIFAEAISPKIHSVQEGAAAAIVFTYKEEEKETATIAEPGKEIEAESEIISETVSAELKAEKNKSALIASLINRINNLAGKLSARLSEIKLKPVSNALSSLTHRRKVFLTIAVILIIVLLLSTTLAIKKQQDEKTSAMLNEVMDSAQKKYDEGISLSDLNKNLANDDFTQALKILSDGKTKFSKDSKEEKQINDFLNKVKQAQTGVSGTTNSKTTTIDLSNSQMLLEESKNSALFFTQDDKNVYGVDASSIFAIDKSTKNKKTIIKNTNYWNNPSGIGVFLGNIYVLDKRTDGQIYKFAASGYAKSDYLPNTQDFSKARAIAIDGSIWIIFQNGEIRKFTKGKADDFKITGLDTPLNSPSKIATDADTNNVYILDNGQSRIVVLAKNGTYQEQYKASILKDAKDFEVVEKDKKIYVLVKDKLYEIELK